jgi:hypothetical protein
LLLPGDTKDFYDLFRLYHEKFSTSVDGLTYSILNEKKINAEASHSATGQWYRLVRDGDGKPHLIFKDAKVDRR